MNKTPSYIGLCKKAGKLVCGTELTTEAIRAGKVKAAFTAKDASANTVKRISDGCRYRSIPYSQLSLTCAELGKAAGKDGGIASVGVTDGNFAGMIIRSLEEEQQRTAEFI